MNEDDSEGLVPGRPDPGRPEPRWESEEYLRGDPGVYDEPLARSRSGCLRLIALGIAFGIVLAIIFLVVRYLIAS
jgi:hypothetical protein